jgi:hypothetical protein
MSEDEISRNRSGGNDDNQNPSDRMRFRGSDIAIFFVAVFFLSTILFAGFEVEEIQRNILYLVVLSLSCAMVFAFLPYDSRVETSGFLKAGGTAAVFAFCLYMVTNFTEKGYLKYKENADLQISILNDTLSSREKLIDTLRSAAEKNINAQQACSAMQEQISSIVAQTGSALDSLSTDIAEGVQYSSAARDNSSDARTCSLRGSQSLAALSRAAPRIDTIKSNLKSLISISN